MTDPGRPHPADGGNGVSAADRAVEQVFREEHGRLLASLVGRFGDLDLAEEVASEAVEAALRHWPVDGVPARPGAWLLTTARRPPTPPATCPTNGCTCSSPVPTPRWRRTHGPPWCCAAWRG
jgi:hypothetical protein